MNDNKHAPHNESTQDEPTPLDAFEREWTALLAEREPDLVRSEDAFTKRVLDQHEQASARPAVIGRLGLTPAQFAAAAALLIAALVGWYVLTDGSADTAPDEDLVVEKTPAPQPDDGSAVDPNDPPKLQLGKLIAQTRSTVTQPASNLTATVRDTPQALRVQRLLDLIDSPVPDLNELLAPLKPDETQSRA